MCAPISWPFAAMVWTSAHVMYSGLPETSAIPTGPASGLTIALFGLPVMMYCVVRIPAASKIGKPLSYVD